MPWYDVTLSLHEAVAIYPGDPPFRLHWQSRVRDGEPASFHLARIEMSTHMGTHLDAPLHVRSNGQSVDQLDLDVLCGPARVCDLREPAEPLNAERLSCLPLAGVNRLLFRTGNATLQGRPADPLDRYLTLDGAQFLRMQTAVRLVGIDDLSIEAPDSPDLAVHHALLDGPAPIVILEGLDLESVAAGDYELVCLPLRLQGGDAAPVRAVLRTA